ncbi:YkgB [Ilyonectria robusta]
MRTSSLWLLWAASCNAATLFAADSGGNVTTLSLTKHRHDYALSIIGKTADCGPNPSWLTLDRRDRVLYCLDRGASTSTSGSLNSFSVDGDGSLSRVSRVQAPLSGVAGAIVTTPLGGRGYVTASYNRSAASVIALGKNGALPGPGPLQLILPNITETGPVASRQDRSYLHHVIIDPTNTYIVIPDLGGDRCRVFAYDKHNVAPIVEVGELTAEPGSGPRHGVFRVMANGDTFFFHNGELSQKVYSYRVKYQRKGLSFTRIFDIPALDAGLPATTAPASEIAMSPDHRFLVVSNREKSFSASPLFGSGPSDTLSTFAIKEDGTLKLVQLTPSGGWLPRQFSFNKAGDKIAVGHQGNQTVVIWKRDVKSGKIIAEDKGGKLGQIQLTGPVVATIWDE